MKTIIAIFSACLAITAPLAAQATVNVDKPDYAPGETITVSWTGATAATDWLGIYPKGEIPDGNPVATAWVYVSGSKTAGSVVDSGSAPFTVGVGEWTAWMLGNDSYTPKAGATPVDFSVIDPAPSITLFAAASNLTTGSPVDLSWTIKNGDQVTTLTLDDGTNPPLDVLGQSSIAVNPSGNTTYTLEVNGGEDSATTLVMVAAESTAAFSLDKTTFTVGETVTVSWTGAAGGATDWVGIYTAGTTPGLQNSFSWNYLNGSQTAAAGPVDGSLEFNLPAGNYYALLLLNDGYEIDRGPIPFTVVEPPEEIIPVESVVRSGDTVTLVWQSKAGHEYDIYASADLEGDPQVDWENIAYALPSDGEGTTGFTEVLTVPAPARRFYKIFEFPSAP
ncbi:hypothetical protein [Luteolibacter marinus]|uniref:hypothetical protein n=1 Tax=Luteolibacter marinus TaxID=2776705 RepID=UPI0018689DAC|nr:hypothetical protein [Luteolibacter marinus]